MKNFVDLLLKNTLTTIKRILGIKKSLPPVRCQFCGEMGHDMNDCPNSAKYKLFNVDSD